MINFLRLKSYYIYCRPEFTKDWTFKASYWLVHMTFALLMAAPIKNVAQPSANGHEEEC